MTTIDAAALFSSSLASDAAEVFGTGPVISLTCCYALLFHLTQSYCISIFTQPYSEFIGPGVSTLLLHFCSCFWQNLMMFFQVEIKKQPGATLAGLFGNSRILSRQQTTCRTTAPHCAKLLSQTQTIQLKSNRSCKKPCRSVKERVNLTAQVRGQDLSR